MIVIRRKDGEAHDRRRHPAGAALVATFQTWRAKIEDALIECARLAPVKR